MTEKTEVATITPQESPRSLSEIAKSMYGDDFKGEVTPEAPRSGALTVDQAYERLLDRRDERRVDERVEVEPEVPAEIPEEVEPGARWSDEDVQTIALLQQEAALFQQDLSAFAQAKRTGIDALAKGDKAKAAALRTQMQEAESELTARYETLQQVYSELQTKASDFAVKQATRHLAREKDKLARAMPDLDRQALREYLTLDGSFTADEVKQAFDHRLVVLAEKARRYDESRHPQRADPRKVPMLKKGHKPQPQPAPRDSSGRPLVHGSMEWAVQELKRRRQRSA